MSSAAPANLRILLVDDNPAIHDDFRRILAPDARSTDLDAEANALFDAPVAATVANTPFELDSAHQGQEAREMTIAACQAGRPYALAFVDMRMPPGWDGLVTIGKLWEVDPELNVVICTAHSDHSWEEIQAALPVRERWLVLKKPFDKIEVLQLAHALTEKWHLTRLARAQRTTLEQMVASRTAELQQALHAKDERLGHLARELAGPQEARPSAEKLLQQLEQILALTRSEAGAKAP